MKNLLRRIIRKILENHGQKSVALRQQIAQQIAEFYLDTNKCGDFQETYKKAIEEITALRISSIDFKRGDIVITLMRPGLLIGRHGENINALEKFLRKKITFKEIKIKEERILGALFPYMAEVYD